MVVNIKRATIRQIALVNCIVAIIALILRDAANSDVVSEICKWVLRGAWFVQGIYIFLRYREK